MADPGSSHERPAKAATKKAPARKAPPPRSARQSGAQAAAHAVQQLVELTGREVEGVVGLKQDKAGWTVQVEVLEMRRIPNTTDVLALYEVDVDRSAEVVSYRRLDRYMRGSAGEGRS
ncbi:gas vesicle protein GvpO [Nocardioides kongjuensis]|uniref:gas vesicle protein GvpO n=1 Tax=Nocardioides kongjuensis TaxID=349522 RepID=UPI0015C87DCC|nr:gas vesicle protein GvpO [Nocardioides kongjuensis]